MQNTVRCLVWTDSYAKHCAIRLDLWMVEEGRRKKENTEKWMQRFGWHHPSWFTLMGYLWKEKTGESFQQMTRHCCSLAAFPYQGARMFHSLGLLLLAGLMANFKLSCSILKLVAEVKLPFWICVFLWRSVLNSCSCPVPLCAWVCQGVEYWSRAWSEWSFPFLRGPCHHCVYTPTICDERFTLPILLPDNFPFKIRLSHDFFSEDDSFYTCARGPKYVSPFW